MKRVLLSAYACIPNHGSEEGNGWSYATLLSGRGYEIHCLTQEKNRAAIEAFLKVEAFPYLTFHYVQLPAWINRRYVNTFGVYFHYLSWQWAAERLAQVLDDGLDFDLVHHATYGSAQLGSFLYKLGKPFIFGPVGGGQRAPKAFKSYFGRYWSREWMRDIVSNVLEQSNPAYLGALKHARKVIVTNRDTLHLVRRKRKHRPVNFLLDAGLSASFMPPAATLRTPGKTLQLLWVGRLMPRKALELTIQAVSKVDQSIPILLTIVGGKGEMHDLVRGYIEQNGVQDRVKWVGHVTYDEVKQYYRESDVFVFTSLRDSCPMQLLEAMAYSLPIVTLALHGQGELVNGENGIKVTVTTPSQVVADVAQAIEWMHSNPVRREEMGAAGYAFVQDLIWPQKIKKFADEWYEEVMAEAS